MLKNVAYIGKREAPGPDGPVLVDAVWSGILDLDLFERVQALMATNARTGHSAVKRSSHTYILSDGLTRCGRCGGTMQGRSGACGELRWVSGRSCWISTRECPPAYGRFVPQRPQWTTSEMPRRFGSAQRPCAG